MKQLLLALIILPLSITAQTVLNKPVKIFDGGTSLMSAGKPHVITLYRTIQDLDSSYSFAFDDHQYEQLTVVKTIVFRSKEELRSFAKALKLAEKSKLSEQVTSNYEGDKKSYIISKEKIGLGGISYQIFTDGGYCYLNSKKSEKLLKVIDNE